METKSINDITIENMLDNIFTNIKIKKKRKDIVEYYKQHLITDLFGTTEADEQITENDIIKAVEQVLKEDRQLDMPYLNYAKSYYSKNKNHGKDINPIKVDSNYIGKAGECAVMSELLFRGYNVNNMMVDEGIDLVASKDNLFYYIQVKTKTIEEKNKLYFQVKEERFNTFIGTGTQMRYILVGRCIIKGEIRDIFFQFNNTDIQRFLSLGVIPIPAQDSKTLSIKIEFEIRTGKAYLYDGRKRDDISFYMNNFNL